MISRFFINKNIWCKAAPNSSRPLCNAQTAHHSASAGNHTAPRSSCRVCPARVMGYRHSQANRPRVIFCRRGSRLKAAPQLPGPQKALRGRQSITSSHCPQDQASASCSRGAVQCISRESSPGHIDGNDVFYH